MNRQKRRFRTSVMWMLLTLVGSVLFCAVSVFNVMMRSYIESNAKEQLGGVVAQSRRTLEGEKKFNEIRVSPGGTSDAIVQLPPFPGSRLQIQLPRGQTGRMDAIVCDANYQLLEASAPFFFSPETNQWQSDAITLLEHLRQQSYGLDSGQILCLQIAEYEYYLAGMPLDMSGSQYIIYYLDTTALSAFMQSINVVFLLLLLLVIPLTLLISAYISGRISKPIQDLSGFAQRIGRGDFRLMEQQYQDREFCDLAQNMNLAAAQLEAYDHEQQTFFQNVSHELRTPLQVIKINAEGLQHGILETRRACGEISKETDRLTAMVEDLLYLSRMDSVANRLEPVLCDLREILAEAAEQQLAVAEEKGLVIEYDFDAEPVEILGDEKHLRRACANLISNAARYAVDRIVLSCHEDAEGPWLAVQDDGPGVAEADHGHIFDRFYSGVGGKHGIGLAIVKGIIEQHRGTIRVENLPGACFTIQFPKLEEL